jgi:FtsH-binding integral membrane protein
LGLGYKQASKLRNPSVCSFIYSLVGALLFSLYIVYDTDNLIKRFSYDEYVWASVGLYLDIINLFLRLLQILKALQGKHLLKNERTWGVLACFHT